MSECICSDRMGSIEMEMRLDKAAFKDNMAALVLGSAFGADSARIERAREVLRRDGHL